MQVFSFLREFFFEFVEVRIEVSGHRERGTIRKMKVIDRIHLHPAISHTEVTQQLAGNSLRITEQRIKVSCCIERKTLATEGAAIAADHVMLFNEQHAQPFTRQKICADQTADTGSDNHGIVRSLRRLAAQSFEQPFHNAFNFGRFRPYVSCAATNSPLAIAAPIESSPASNVAQMISANLPARPLPAQPRISKHSRLVPSAVPPPTVATVNDGSVTLAYRSPSWSNSKFVIPTAELTMLATSCPHAMKIAAKPL